VGAAVARALAQTHDLLLGGRDEAALAKICAEIPRARPWRVELTEVTERDVAGIDRLDLLVHSAGIVEIGTLADTPAHVWRRTLDVNVVAVAELTRLLLPALRAARGHVVLVNSGAGQRANPRWGSYAASKFALRAFADVLRQEEHPYGVRVTSLYPGRVDTDMQRGVRAQERGEYEPDKYLDPDSVAAALVTAVTAAPDAHITEMTIRPAAGPVS
jgi:NADP-dependent 3-hydroxy acid dehydrogenase YdfG